MNLADLGPGAVELPADAVFDMVVLDDATEDRQEVRCRRAVGETTAATDPMPWSPYTVEGLGTWFPKKGNRAIVLQPVDGPPAIVAWWPAADTAADLTP